MGNIFRFWGPRSHDEMLEIPMLSTELYKIQNKDIAKREFKVKGHYMLRGNEILRYRPTSNGEIEWKRKERLRSKMDFQFQMPRILCFALR